MFPLYFESIWRPSQEPALRTAPRSLVCQLQVRQAYKQVADDSSYTRRHPSNIVACLPDQCLLDDCMTEDLGLKSFVPDGSPSRYYSNLQPLDR
jgi:hypothetical protein